MNRSVNRTTRRWWPWVVAVLWVAWACRPLWAQESVATDPAEPLNWLRDIIQRRGVGWALPAIFLGGLALNLTPCVYPMIPVTMAFFSSQAADLRGRRTAFLAVCYVLGISINYAVLGLIAAKTGALFGSWLQQPAVLIGLLQPADRSVAPETHRPLLDRTVHFLRGDDGHFRPVLFLQP